MPLTEWQLRERDAKRDIGAELLEAVRQVKSGHVGKVSMVPTTLAAQARRRLGMSQAQLAERLGVSQRTLQAWEQGRRDPTGPARVLLKIAIARPDVVREVVE